MLHVTNIYKHLICLLIISIIIFHVQQLIFRNILKKIIHNGT